MKYDFDEIIPRRGTNSVKWDLATDERVLPMWVADMDFRAAPPVLDALERRLRHGVFGYTKVPDAYFEAVKGWFGKRHGFRIENEWILPTTGVIPALSVILKALTEPGDKVILQTPVYNCFFAVLERTGRQPLANPLIEIHCDLTLDGHRHIPFASLNEEFLRHSVTCTAPSKTFNIAGLQAANIIAADPEIRRKIDRQLVDNELHALNAFAVEALIAAYNEGGEWLDELKKYLWENYEYLRDFFTRHLPALPVTPLEATYLVWVDCRTLKRPTTEIARQLLEEGHVWINEGEMYAGEGFLRINIACPRKTLAEGLERIRKVVG